MVYRPTDQPTGANNMPLYFNGARKIINLYWKFDTFLCVKFCFNNPLYFDMNDTVPWGEDLAL